MKTMNWTVFVCVIFMNTNSLYARMETEKQTRVAGDRSATAFMDKVLTRRKILGPHEVILGVPRRPEHLPKALRILPGHTLLRPSKGMLKSAVKFPLRDIGGSTVYGNLGNLGISWGKIRGRVRYTDFRKANNLLSGLPSIFGQIKPTTKNRNRQLVVIEIDRSELEAIAESISNAKNSFGTQVSEEEGNNANEILDDLDARSFEDSDSTNLRRSKHKKLSKDQEKYDDWIKRNSGSSSSGSSSESEKNPGNPYTIHKNKYKQNWMWNYNMDGDHMNVNPYAPQLSLLGPSGADLFFGRKWWYYNQDDYKPMGRRMNSI